MSIFLDSLPVGDRGLHYGDGLFETMAVTGGQVRLLPLHMERLALGAARLAFPPLDRQGLAESLQQAAQELGEGVLKLIVTRGCGGRGYLPPELPEPSLVLLRHLPLDSTGQDGVSVRLCELRLSRQPALAGIKHLNRLEHVLARAEWQDPAIAEGLLRDAKGFLIEGVVSNLFLVQDGRLLTPLLDLCGVVGVMRTHVMQRAAALGLALEERRLRLDDLLAADEVFITNSLHGIRPVLRLSGHGEWPAGVVTRTLQHALWGQT